MSLERDTHDEKKPMTAKPLRISIVTPTFNSENHLEQTIESVLNQEFSKEEGGLAVEVEHLIIDGGSTDGTLEIIRKYESRLAYWVSEPDHGISDAFNKGIRRATGDMIGIINSDDYYAPTTLAVVAKAWQNQPNAIFHGNMMYLDKTSERELKPRPFQRFFWYVDMPVYHPTCFVPRAAYDQVGVFNESYQLAMDFDFLLRAKLEGWPFVYLPQALAYFRTGGLAITHAREVYREVLHAQLDHGLYAWPCRAGFAAKMTANWIKHSVIHRYSQLK